MGIGRIYKITCRKNGKMYVGQTTKTLAARWSTHLAHVRDGRSCALQCAIRKYGEEAFQIDLLEECPTESLNAREIFWIAELGTVDPERGYNRTHGGHTPPTAEVLDRLSKMRMGSGNPMFGRDFSKSHRAALSRSLRGRIAPNKGKSFPRVDNRMLTVDGVTRTISDWARRVGLSLCTLTQRLDNLGWSIDDAVKTPHRRERYNAEVLDRLRRGENSRQISAALGIPASTVRAMRGKFRKMGKLPVT